MTPSTPRHVGIVACSAEGASLCYRTLCSEGATLLGAYGHPEVSLHTHPHSAYVRCLERNDWSGVAELMRPAADPRFDAPARARRPARRDPRRHRESERDPGRRIGFLLTEIREAGHCRGPSRVQPVGSYFSASLSCAPPFVTL